MENETNPSDILRVLWKNRLLIIGIFFIAVIVAGVISFTMQPIYRASSIIALGNNNDPVYASQASAKEIMLSDDFLSEVIKQQNLSVPPDWFLALKDGIDIEPLKGTDNLLVITAETPQRQESKMLVDGIVLLFINRTEESNKKKKILIERLASAQKTLDLLDTDINQTREALKSLENSSDLSPIDKELTISRKMEYLKGVESERMTWFDSYLSLQVQLDLSRSAEVVKPAAEPESPVKSQRSLILAVAGMLGLIIGIFAAFLREMLWRRAE